MPRKPSADPTVKTSVTLPGSIRQRADAEAAAMRLNLSGYLTYVLRDRFTRPGKR